MEKITQKLFTDERALFQADGLELHGTIFEEGESPLKHSRNITMSDTIFRGKYPLWYCKDITMKNSSVFDTARAGLWYADNVSITDSIIAAPKMIRRCKNVSLENVSFPGAAETVWECSDIKMKNVSVNGDYLCMNCNDIEIDGLDLTGKYCFDGVKNVHITNSRMIGRDAFWNSENVTVENSFISGAYIGWNSKKLTFINCTIESLQGFCYIDDLVMKNCRLINTTLAFEYSTVDVEVTGSIDSVINPSGGIIRADSIGNLTMEAEKVDISKTVIVTES